MYRPDCGAIGQWLGSQRLGFSRTGYKLSQFMAMDFVPTFLAFVSLLGNENNIFKQSANLLKGKPVTFSMDIQLLVYPEMRMYMRSGARGEKRLEVSLWKYLCLSTSS